MSMQTAKTSPLQTDKPGTRLKSRRCPVGKRHCHVFLGGLDPGQTPLKTLFVDAKTNLSILISLLKPKVHFLKVTRVITLAPHEVHPYNSTERRYLPSWWLYRNKVGISCLRLWMLSLVVPHPKTPILNCCYHVLWFYFLTVSEFSCLAKSYSVSALTPLPHIPNQHHFIQESAHEVLDANLEARVRPVFT